MTSYMNDEQINEATQRDKVPANEQQKQNKKLINYPLFFIPV